MPAALALTGLLLAVMAWMTMYGLLTAHNYSLGPVLETLARLFEKVSIPLPGRKFNPLAFAADAVRALDHSIRHLLAKGIHATEWPILQLWHAASDLIFQTLDATAQLAESTANVLAHTLVVTIPGATRHAISRAHAEAERLARGIDRVERTLAHRITNRIAWLHRLMLAEAARLARGIDRVHHTLARQIAHDRAVITTRVRAAERRIGLHNTRIGRLEKTLTAAGFGALFVATLHRFGLGWLRCGNVKRVGRNLCGMDANLLESLVTDTLLIVGTVSIVEFAREMETVVDEASTVIRKFWEAD